MAIGRVTFSNGPGGGGVAPKNVQNIKIRVGKQKLTISWTDPTDTVVEDQTLCTWKGTKVVYKAGSYPTSPTDGIVAVDSQVRDAYKTNGFEVTGLNNDVTYYFQIFPYSDTGVYNTNTVNRISGTPKAFKIYGIKRSLTSSSTEWERLNDSVGLVANAQVGSTPVTNDFDSLYPWSDIISCNYNNTAKQVVAYYGDATYKADGTNGQVMTIIPEFWYKRYQEDGYEYIYIADADVDDTYTKSNQFMIGRYTMSGSASNVYSRSGYAQLVSKTISDFRSYARNLGEGWQQLDIWRYAILKILYLVEYADYNSQLKLGRGNVDSGSKINSGGCDSLGMKSGYVGTNGSCSVIYRGVEDIYGNIRQWLDGINISSRKSYVCTDPTKYASDMFSGDYVALSYTNCSSTGYISRLGYDADYPLAALPMAVNGSSDTYIPDYYYQGSDIYVACVGGRYSESDLAGLWYLYCYYSSSIAHSHIGARPLILKKLNFRDLMCVSLC